MADYSDKARRDAIWALECCADLRVAHDFATCTWDLLGRFPRPSSDYLADAAYKAAVRWVPNVNYGAPESSTVTFYLEAAALLRDGWSPGDPVEVRTVRP